MKSQDIVIYGASGHGKVIADVVTKSGDTVRAFVDDRKELWKKQFCGFDVWHGMADLVERHAKAVRDFFVIIAIGDNFTRQRLVRALYASKVHFGTAIHPSAQIGKGVIIGKGSVVMANSVINPGAHIGTHCIINTAAVIEHDCVLEDFVQISTGVCLAGRVKVDRSAWIGVGASVIQGIRIAENAVVGAGSVVIKNVEANSVVVGNPAAFLRKNE